MTPWGIQWFVVRRVFLSVSNDWVQGRHAWSRQKKVNRSGELLRPDRSNDALWRENHDTHGLLIANAKGPDGYRLGRFSPGWGEWNDRFRDDVRAFWLTGTVGTARLPNDWRDPARYFATRVALRSPGSISSPLMTVSLKRSR